MTDSGAGHALRIERSCALVASAFSEGRRVGVRLVSGERRSFGMNASRTIVNVPYPALAPSWTLRSLTCGVALQCAPSKDRIARYPLHELSPRELGALAIVEGAVALGWIGARWRGLLSGAPAAAARLEMESAELDAPAMVDRARTLARSGRELRSHALLGQLPLAAPAQRGLLASVRRMYGQMPWSSKRTFSRRSTRSPSAAKAEFTTRTCLPEPARGRRRRGSIRSARRHPVSGVERSGRRAFFRITWPCSSASTRPTPGRPSRSRATCVDGSRSTRIAR